MHYTVFIEGEQIYISDVEVKVGSDKIKLKNRESVKRRFKNKIVIKKVDLVSKILVDR